MKVSVDILQRIYESLQNQGHRADTEIQKIDPESHLHFIDAFEMPLWHWSQERGTFEKYVAGVSLRNAFSYTLLGLPFHRQFLDPLTLVCWQSVINSV